MAFQICDSDCAWGILATFHCLALGFWLVWPGPHGSAGTVWGRAEGIPEGKAEIRASGQSARIRLFRKQPGLAGIQTLERKPEESDQAGRFVLSRAARS